MENFVRATKFFYGFEKGDDNIYAYFCCLFFALVHCVSPCSLCKNMQILFTQFLKCVKSFKLVFIYSTGS